MSYEPTLVVLAVDAGKNDKKATYTYSSYDSTKRNVASSGTLYFSCPPSLSAKVIAYIIAGMLTYSRKPLAPQAIQ